MAGAEPDPALHLAAVVEAASEAIVALDAGGCVLAWNRGATDVYGYGRDEAIGQHFSIVDVAGTGDVDKLIKRALAGETVRDHHGVRRRKDGTLVDISTTYTPHVGEHGVVTAISVVGRDVTDIRASQRRAERVAHELDIILNSASDAIYRLNTSGRVAFANEAAGRLFGSPPEELVGQDMHVLHHHTRPDGTPYPREDCPIVKALPSGESVRLHSELLFRADGSPVYVDLTVTPALEQGEVAGSVVVLSDISERLTAERAAKEALDRFEDAFHGAPIGMALVDLRPERAGEYLEVNAALCRMLGRSADEVVGRTYEDFTHPDDVAADAARLAGVLAGAAAQPAVRKRYVARDGTSVWVFRTASVVPDDEMPYAVIQIQDITEQVRAEQELRRSEARYRTLVEAANEGVWAFGADGRTTFVNSRMGSILGVVPGDVIGRDPREFVVDHAVAEPAFERIRAGLPSRVEVALRRADGETVPVLVSAAPLRDDEGDPAGALAMVVDLRDRLKAEAEKQTLQEQLHQSQKLEIVGQLAGGIAHDFNNLLGVIINYADFAITAMESHAARGDVVEIRRAAERAAELTQQLLVFSRKGVVSKELVDVNSVILDFERLLRRAVGYDVLLGLTLGPELPPVCVNRGQLEQVLLNLAMNAGDAMPDGGTLEIATSAVRRNGGASGDPSAASYVRIVVTDTGAGMTAAVRARAFEPFFTTKPQGSGTGLGLATAYGMVTEAGGRIDIASTPHAGTTVTIDLPSAPPTDAGGAATERDAAASGKSILVVEDEEAVRTLTARILERAGYRVTTAADGADGLRLIERCDGAIDVVVTDVVMPKMSGPAMATALRERWPHIGVLFMSGYADREERVPPGSPLVPKPFNGKQLLAEVEQLLRGGTSPDQRLPGSR